MEEQASHQDTLKALTGLGFVPIATKEGENVQTFLNSPKSNGSGIPMIQIHTYKCRNGYWCVDAEGGWMAPVVWNGPRADWDDSDPLADFVGWLDKNRPGWR